MDLPLYVFEGDDPEVPERGDELQRLVAWLMRHAAALASPGLRGEPPTLKPARAQSPSRNSSP